MAGIAAIVDAGELGWQLTLARVKNTVTIIDLIRHGEPVGGRKYRGQTDDPLSEKGFRQMWDSVGDFHAWQQIVTSPLSRCAAFAQALHQKWDIPVAEDARLKEIGFGAWEGKTPQQLCEHDAQILQRFKRDPVANQPAGAEPLPVFAARVAQAWQDVVVHHAGKQVLLVVHAGVIRMIIAHILGIPLNRIYLIQVGSAAVSRIVIEGEGDNALASLVFHDGKLR